MQVIIRHVVCYYTSRGVLLYVTWCVIIRHVVCYYTSRGVLLYVTWCVIIRHVVCYYTSRGVLLYVTWCVIIRHVVCAFFCFDNGVVLFIFCNKEEFYPIVYYLLFQEVESVKVANYCMRGEQNISSEIQHHLKIPYLKLPSKVIISV